MFTLNFFGQKWQFFIVVNFVHEGMFFGVLIVES